MKQPKIVQVPGEPSPMTLRLILNMGHILLITLLVSWIFFFHFRGEPYDNPFIVAASQLLAGRAGGVGLGLRRGFSSGFMLYQTAMVDMILMLYVYPIFVRGYQHLTMVPGVGGYLANIHKVALSHKKRMAPYGALGLMLFVIFPFWSTGCVVGAIVGYLIGLPSWLALGSVTLGNWVAITAWVVFYDRLQEWNETAALILLLVVFLMAAAGVLFARIHKSRKSEQTNEYIEESDAQPTDTNQEKDAMTQDAPAAPGTMPDAPEPNEQNKEDVAQQPPAEESQ